MEDWQERVIAERDELGARLIKLSAFVVQSPAFRSLGNEEKQRLRRQRETMLEYHEILEDRIAAWADEIPF